MLKTDSKKIVLEWNNSNSYYEDEETKELIYNEFEYEDFLCELDEFLEKFNPKAFWYCRVENFGWLKQSGKKYFFAENGKDFLNKILPRTECNFKIYKSKNELQIQNYHHDSPHGNEWYYCKKISKKVYDVNKIN